MITRAEIEKLGALHVVEPAMVSLYLAVPPPADLAARAAELIAAAEAACGQPVTEQDRTWPPASPDPPALVPPRKRFSHVRAVRQCRRL